MRALKTAKAFAHFHPASGMLCSLFPRITRHRFHRARDLAPGHLSPVDRWAVVFGSELAYQLELVYRLAEPGYPSGPEGPEVTWV